MKLSELILAVGDDNILFQNLDQSAISLDWSRKAGSRITFGTEQTIIPGEGTERLGLILWLDREAASAAIAKVRAPPAAPNAAVLAANGGLTPREARDDPSNSQAVTPLTAQAET